MKFPRFIDWSSHYDRLLLLGLILASLISFCTSAPRSFPSNTLIEVTEGTDLTTISEKLQQVRVIRYPALFNWLINVSGAERAVLAGDYWFEKPLTVWEVASRLIQGRFSIEPVKITIPEGVTVREMAEIFSKQLTYFDAEAFIDLALPFEGYLFPDTYFFPQGVKPSEVVEVLRDNFRRQLKTINELVAKSEHSLAEVMVMASIIEEEAYDPEVRRLIAGILWKRFAAEMPLQVDAVFPYIIGKNSFQLSRADLQFDSPYNTYRHRGLPPGPISNPGLDAITAALAPEPSDYWYYLSDRQGKMYYAEDFAAHKLNKQKYLY